MLLIVKAFITLEVSCIEKQSEQCLAEKLASGDEQALAELISRYTGYVSVIVTNIIGGSMSQSDLEETVSDVFFTLWKNREKVQSEKLRAYLASIARSRSKNKLRELRLSEALEEDFLELPELSPEDELDEKEQKRALYEALDELSDRDREVFIRHYYYYESTAAIAKATGLRRETVKTILKNGRQKLKNKLTKGGCFCEA